MNANIAFNFAPRATAASVRKVSVRKLIRARVVSTRRPITLAPSASARVESALMGLTFTALAGLAVLMEAVGASLF